MESITFKPYATGTMNQPYVDCAIRLAQKGIRAEDVADVAAFLGSADADYVTGSTYFVDGGLTWRYETLH